MKRGTDSAAHSGAAASQGTGWAHAARLRFWIIGVGALVLTSLAGSAAYDAWLSYDKVVSANRRELDNLAKALAGQADGTLQLVDLLLRETAAWYEHDRPVPGEAANARLAARAVGLPPVRMVSILDEQGTARIRSRPIPPGAVEVSLADRDYFLAQRDRPNVGVFLSEPVITRLEQRSAFIMSRRLENADGTFAGVVSATVDLDAFQQVYEALNLGESSAMNLLRADGMLIVRQPPVSQAVGKRFPDLIAPGPEAEGIVSPIDQKQRFQGMAHVAHFPLVVAVTREKDVALEVWRDEAKHVAVRTLVLTLLGTLALMAVLHQVRRVATGERALRESEQRYAMAMEGANEGHFDWNFEHDDGFLSAQMKLLHGRNADAPVTTRAAWMATVDIHPDDRERMTTLVRDHFEGRTDRYEAEYRVRHPDGEWHWLLARGRCLRGPSGNVQRFAGSAMDITARKHAEAEKERLEAQLRQSQKLEAMGTLAGGIAHDFNNILGAILGYGELAQKASAEGSVVRRYIDNVMQAGGRAKALVERILAFSRSGMSEQRSINVQAIIEETVELVAASLPPGVQLIKRLEAGDVAVIGDATQLHQVAMNLCTNGLQAMSNHGVLEVMLERLTVAESRELSHGTLQAGEYVRLCVSDTGEGIPAAVLECMFDPFFTTKRVGEGTGLGLSLVHGIVVDLGGTMDVHTIVGRGTTFTVWLPAKGEVAATRDHAPDELPRGHGETVLIVDDEKALVLLAEEMLAGLGYEPVGFNSSVQALQAFRATPDRFDIVLSDETMPELVGTDLASEMQRIRPDIPIVIMSGYAGTRLLERTNAIGVREVLRKPLQTRDLADSLARTQGALRSRVPVKS